MRNIEIKAKVHCAQTLLAKAKILTGSEPTIIKQHDTFYHSQNGRLKLRRLDQNAELIFYDRSNDEGPKVSSYEKATINNSEETQHLHKVLSKALGTKVEVKKIRYLFLLGSTRIHVDNVEGLGDFMELEVVLNDNQSISDGEKVCHSLMQKLGIEEKDLISGAYADMFKNPVL